MEATLRIGTAGWSYPDWNGVVFPKRVPTGFDPLRYLAAYVDVIEINNTFYRAPPARVSERWAHAVEGLDDFRFTAKLYRGFTHAPPLEWNRGDVDSFRDGVRPLTDAGRLEALLAQFPFYFDASPENLDHIHRIAEAFAVAPLVVEVRHRSFLAPAVLDWFRTRAISFCNVDQPLARTSIEPGAHVTGSIGYFRLHGRNRDAWFSPSAGRDEKYDYLYSRRELESCVPWIHRLVQETSMTFVVANNHFLGKGAVNALELKALLQGTPVDVPDALVAAYPRLAQLDTNQDGSS